MKRNDWQKRFGAARRATDRALLAECERQIATEEAAGGRLDFEGPKITPKPQKPPSTAQDRIAQGFWRPV